MDLKINPFKENECVQDELTGDQGSRRGFGRESRALSRDCAFRSEILEGVQKPADYSKNCIGNNNSFPPPTVIVGKTC